MGKQNLYEHSWRVPFIVSGPGIKAGTRAKGNNYLLDILPTVCDLAGINIPDTVQGKSVKPVLMGKTQQIRNVLYGAIVEEPSRACGPFARVIGSLLSMTLWMELSAKLSFLISGKPRGVTGRTSSQGSDCQDR